jgi:hypothetical protein
VHVRHIHRANSTYRRQPERIQTERAARRTVVVKHVNSAFVGGFEAQLGGGIEVVVCGDYQQQRKAHRSARATWVSSPLVEDACFTFGHCRFPWAGAFGHVSSRHVARQSDKRMRINEHRES